MEQKITFDKFIRWTFIGLIVLAVFFITKSLSSVLIPFFVAWLFAYLLYPIVKFVQYKMHVPTRALSIIITLIFVTAILSGIFYLIIPPMIGQFERLSHITIKYIQHSSQATDITKHVQQWLI